MTRTESSGRPVSVKLLLGILAFQGLSGLAGGFGLIADPTGTGLGVPVTWLEGSPFGSYLVPGIILFVVLGLVPLIVSVGLWRCRRWARTASLLVGIALIVWIGAEILIIGYHPVPPLQLVYGLLGILIIGLALLVPEDPPPVP